MTPRDDERLKFEAQFGKRPRPDDFNYFERCARWDHAFEGWMARARAEQAETPRAAELYSFHSTLVQGCQQCGSRLVVAAAPVEDRPAPTPPSKPEDTFYWEGKSMKGKEK